MLTIGSNKTHVRRRDGTDDTFLEQNFAVVCKLSNESVASWKIFIHAQRVLQRGIMFLPCMPRVMSPWLLFRAKYTSLASQEY